MFEPQPALTVMDEIAPAVTTPERTDEDMSTQHPLNSPTTPGPSPQDPPRPHQLDLSITKILGGALAAMTAAALGSRLSVAGTVVGAAIASIIAAVASALYTASLARTQQKVRTVFTGRTDGSSAVALAGSASSKKAAAPDRTMLTAGPVQPHGTGQATAAAGAATNGPVRRLNWKGIVVGALAAFAVAAAALTGIELMSGRALSGGGGTTISQVGGSGGSAPTEGKTPSPTPSESPTGDPTASASDTPQPSQDPSSTPDPTTEPPAAEPSTDSTPAAPVEPSSPTTPVPSPGGGAGQGTAPTPGGDDSPESAGG